ncbi:hypothetical protein RN001_011919 [Aquatica leii]|uniref:Uncharacterized protein n=1 Tax=Aquatica leii TaxID=1421715 RepID=A0AAN7PTL3_9COLE|nr:hypothetical protein RN001_011919 [Aquatica leii]
MSLSLSENSASFKEWQITRPLTMDIYFFNWTNPEDINNPDIKPRFVEVGPYRLSNIREKVNITWNPHNDTVTYKQLLGYYFDETSPGNFSDVITTIDMVAISLAQRTKDAFFFVKDSAKFALMFSEIYMRATAREMLGGFKHSLVTAANALNFLTGENAPDKFGWFYTPNLTVGFDGVFNVKTKAGSDFGTLQSWNYNNVTSMFKDECGQVQGSAGEFYPQHLKRDHITYFSADFCRPLEFTYEKDVVIKDIPSYKYSASDAIFDNGTKIPKNKCFCTEKCYPSGVMDNSPCRNGVPVFSSLPHFYYADKSYVDKVEGLNPQKEKHEFYFTLEPEIGVITSTAARLQLNVLLQPLPDFQLFKRVPELIFPIFWTEQKVDLYDEHASGIRLLLMAPTINKVFSIVLIVTGLLSISYVSLIMYFNEKRVTKSKLPKVDIPLK